MSEKPKEPRRAYTEREQNEGFVGRRIRAFGERSRDPGDGTTWSTVLGALMLTLLVICFSVAELPLFALATFLVGMGWIVVMSRFGKVNVASVLWGAATSDANTPPVDAVVYQSTLVLALISLVAIVGDAVTGWGFGWYGVILLAAVALFLIIYINSWIRPVR